MAKFNVIYPKEVRNTNIKKGLIFISTIHIVVAYIVVS